MSSNGTDIAKGPQGTFFDKSAPTGPPTPERRNIPKALLPIVAFFEGIIADEGLLLDLCTDKAISIVEFNYKKRLVGNDFFGEQLTGANFCGIATPLAVELYKQVLLSVKDRSDDYQKLVKTATEEIRAHERKSPIILQP